MTVLFVGGIGLLAPGLPGWGASLPVLRGAERHQPQPITPPAPSLLPAGERRRATAASRLVLAVGEQALGAGSGDTRHVSCVFASASGELGIVDSLCRALGEPDRPVSPTQFHNSVHNAPAGYWSIATGSRAPSLSLSAYDASFAAGLLEATVIVAAEQAAVLLLAYDLPAPPPLDAKRPIVHPFAAALLLSPRPIAAGAVALSVATAPAPCDEPALADPSLEALRRDNPAARCLPLLCALASGRLAPVRLAAGPLSLVIGFME